MIDLSFMLGLALGTIVTGFCAIGSFNRGFDSVRRRSWSTEHAARKRAVVASRTALRATARPSAKGAVARAG
jgi:hypothetical protein